jgi:hypothetical protein
MTIKLLSTKKSLVMKPSIGVPSRGDKFYRRDKLIQKIYRRLDTGGHLFMSAPRRVGKTSIMHHLEENPREDYEFIYLIVESVDNSEDYFRVLLKELLQSNAIGKLAKSIDKVNSLIDGISSRIGSIGIMGNKIELNSPKANYQAEFEGFLQQIETKEKTIVLMVDEFPQAVENIKQEKGKEEAKRFLQTNRSIRQSFTNNIRFIYTGSIGLPNVVKGITSLSVINDLNTVEIPPLNTEDAKELMSLLLEEAKVETNPKILDLLIAKIEWLIPFHLQLFAQELIDVCEDSEQYTISEKEADKAFEQILHRRNNQYFEPYRDRLEKSLESNQYQFAVDLLNTISKEGNFLIEDIEGLAKKHQLENYKSVLEALEFDGYINSTKASMYFHFTSLVLKMWWKKNVANF